MLLTFPICVSLMLSCILLGVFQFLFLFADISDDVFSFWSPGILFDFLHVWLLMDVFVCCWPASSDIGLAEEMMA